MWKDPEVAVSGVAGPGGKWAIEKGLGVGDS